MYIQYLLTNLNWKNTLHIICNGYFYVYTHTSTKPTYTIPVRLVANDPTTPNMSLCFGAIALSCGGVELRFFTPLGP